MKICSLASGSRGNSILIESDHTRILVDAGLSALQIKSRLESIGIFPGSIDGIIITHAHRDHINGAGVFSRQFNVPVHGHPETLETIKYFYKKNMELVPWKGPFTIKDLHLQPFPVSHDAIPTVGYLVSLGYKKLAICTDLGVVTPEVADHIQQAQFLILESNHDPEMLLNGPYPWELKERIASHVGHLSNHDSGELLRKVLNGSIQQIILAHLSEENNSPELAKNTVLEYIGNKYEDIIKVIEQRKISPVFYF